MYTQPYDSANKTTQILIKENCAGITLYPKVLGGDVSLENFEEATVRVELVRKSQPNSVLYTMQLAELNNIWKGFFKDLKGIVIPFALKDNLLLSKDAYLQIDISWGNTPLVISELKIQKNTLATNTNVPISFKHIDFEDGQDIDTDYFGYIYFTEDVERIETFIDVQKVSIDTKEQPTMGTNQSRSLSQLAVVNATTDKRIATGDCCCTHEVTRQKIEMDYSYMSYFSQMPTTGAVLFKTEPKQTIRLFGEGTVTLMQA